tara:strand:+ start:1353 stop:1733 length:381 start_codon:yes stop_codon:yes gene_type:complete
MTKIDKNAKLKQEIQDFKVRKNARIIAVLFWFASSLYIYSTDVGFSDVYSWKPFVFFILGPIFSAIVFGNIIFYSQKLIEKSLIKLLENSKPQAIPVFVIVIFFCFLIGLFLVIFEFAKILQIILH